jgi:hypothetical protein
MNKEMRRFDAKMGFLIPLALRRKQAGDPPDGLAGLRNNWIGNFVDGAHGMNDVQPAL